MTIGVLCLEDGDKAWRWAADAFVWYYRGLLELARPALESLEESYAYYRRLRRLQGLLRTTLSLTVLEKLGMMVVGDPDACTARLDRLARAGVDCVLCAVGAGPALSSGTRSR